VKHIERTARDDKMDAHSLHITEFVLKVYFSPDYVSFHLVWYTFNPLKPKLV
jgi:hypothetical protein